MEKAERPKRKPKRWEQRRRRLLQETEKLYSETRKIVKGVKIYDQNFYSHQSLNENARKTV